MFFTSQTRRGSSANSPQSIAFVSSARRFILTLLFLAGITAVLTGTVGLQAAAPPMIDGIEGYGTNQVIIHFYTMSNRAYQLQRNDNLGTTNWVTIYTVPSLPPPIGDFQHHGVLDSRTAKQRFYRLKATP